MTDYNSSILIVDDDMERRTLIRQQLSRSGFTNIDFADTYIEGMDIAQKNPIKLLSPRSKLKQLILEATAIGSGISRRPPRY